MELDTIGIDLGGGGPYIPYWGQAILHKYLRPAARELEIEKQFGRHTFRHTCSTLLRSVSTEFKGMQD